jgi:uncharacterized protein (DUF4415 family)
MKKQILEKKSRTDWVRIDALKDEDIDYSDIPELDDAFFKNAVLQMPKTKAAVTLRLDRDILEWLKRQGVGYQTRINAILRLYMDTKRQRAS